MPRRRIGELPLTAAEKSARHRARHPRRTHSEATRAAMDRRRQAEAAERGPLFRRLADAAGAALKLGDLTVMAEQNDPYRLDTPANHILGKWMSEEEAEAEALVALDNWGNHAEAVPDWWQNPP